MDNEPHKLTVLEQACRVADEIARLDAAKDGEPLTVLGSARQLTIHPLIAELRVQRALLAQLLGKLGLPLNDDEQAKKSERRTASAKHAANVKWNKEQG
ncbi:hypothetical protein ACWF82_15130 [Nocardia sp. NPDC055053]